MKFVPLSQFMPYGAPELLGASRRYMMQALMISSALCVATFAVVGLVLSRMPPPPDIVIADVLPKEHEVQPPPDILPREVLRLPVVQRPDFAIPIPVPVVDPHPLVVTDTNARSGRDTGALSQKAGEPDHGAGSRGTEETPPKPPQPNEYVYYDELPVVVKQVEPEYTEIAKIAGVSGLVYAQLLVDRDGRVRNVVINPKYSIPMLNESVITAARQWQFQPAKANGNPVAVWVAVPFNFKLH